MKWVTNSYWILFTGRPGEHQPAVGGISPQWDLVSMVTSSIWIEMIIIVKVKHQSFLLFIIQHCLPYLSPNCTVVELLKLGGWEVLDKHILPHLIWYKNLIAYDLKKKNKFLQYNLLVPVIYLIMISFLWFCIDRFIVKFFFIMQISYWIHCFPELYFQKVKKVSTEKKAILCEKWDVTIISWFTINCAGFFSRMKCLLESSMQCYIWCLSQQLTS